MRTKQDNLLWCLLVNIDNRYHNQSTTHTNDIIKDLEALDWNFTREEINNMFRHIKHKYYIKIDTNGWVLTRSGIEFLTQLQTQNDMYFNPHFEDGHVVWIDLLHYLVDTKTDITEKMLQEIQEKVIEVIEKYRKE